MNSAAVQRSARRSGCRRNRRTMRGGTGSFAYTLGGPVAGAPIINNYGQEIVRFPACEEAVRPGYLEGKGPEHGLPGLYGGRRRGSRKGRKGSRKQRGGRGMAVSRSNVSSSADIFPAQMGGRYTNTFEVVGSAGIALTNPQSINCERDPGHPLNPPPVAPTAPPGIAEMPGPGVSAATRSVGGGSCGMLPLAGGRRTRRGRSRKMRGGVGGVASMYYEVPRTGYTHLSSDAAGGDSGTLADGKTPFLLNVPYSVVPTPSASCLKTGGRRKTRKNRTRKNRRGGAGCGLLPMAGGGTCGAKLYGGRKGRKGSRKGKKGSRKH